MSASQSTTRINKKALLQNTVAGLNLTQASRVTRSYLPTNDVTQNPAPGNSAFNGADAAAKPIEGAEAPEVPPASGSLNTEETGSTVNPVHFQPGSKETGFKTDRVQNQPGPKSTGSEKAPVPKNRLPLANHVGMLRPRDHFTAVPNFLLRDGCCFDDPNDFMIYLRMFSMSFGFGRNTCDMSLAHLIEFTRLGKNAVRRAIERLTKQGWIRVIGDFEPGQVARKWRVFTPWEKGLTPEPTYVPKDEMAAPETPKTTGAETNPVQNRPGSEETQRGFIADLVTGSKTDTYNRKSTKTEERNSSSNSLSLNSHTLSAYFTELRPQRKRESEWKAFQEMRSDFTESQIEAALNHILKNPLPGGEICHSPMAYLATAISDVLAVMNAQREKEQKRAEAAALLEAELKRAEEAQALEDQEWERREAEFVRAFPDGFDQERVIVDLCWRHGFPTCKGKAARTFAVGAWHREVTEGMSQEITA